MIVYWSEARIKVIPAHVPTKEDPTVNSAMCILAPGYNDKPDSEWQAARTFVNDDLASGRIMEEWVKTKKPEPGEAYPPFWIPSDDKKESNTIMVPAMIRDINRPKVVDQVVKRTYHLPTLNKWTNEENRPDVQKALVEQIKAVESGQIRE